MFAEQWAARLAPPVTYVATGWVSDGDMGERIDRHRARRPRSWSTIEVGDGDLPTTLRSVTGTVLLDALGTWLARHQDFEVDATDLCAALTSRSGDTVVVTDEVGLSVHPETAVGVRFRDALGALNQAVAAMADRTVLVVAGRALELGAWDELLP